MLRRILTREFSRFEQWKKAADVELKIKDSWKRLLWNTNEGIEIRPIYFAEDSIEIPDVPGEFPFMRGPYTTMYTHKPWIIRQPSVFNTIAESNAFYKASLAAGQQVLNVYFDIATNRGYDSDNPIVKYDVGRNGVPIDTVEDMRELFNGIPLANISVNIATNGSALPIMAMFIVAAGEQCALLKRLQGTIQNDILKEFLGKNSFIYPPEPSMKIVSDIISYAAQNTPKYNPISISGYYMKEAGADNKLELAFTLANGLEYIRIACNAGLTVDQIAPRLNFFFGVGMDFYMEIAKLRAARFLWAKLLKEKFNPKNVKSLALRANCQTSSMSITEQDPLNNIVRTAIEATASVLGGTQSLYTHSYDEAVGAPTENSARIAKNTQIILQEETGVTKVADPWGGSYFMENLTKELADAALKVINEIESLGGMTKAIEKGIPRRMILESAARRQAKIDSGQEAIVGVNKYKIKGEDKIEAQIIDNTQIRDEQIRKIRQIKATRNNDKVNEALDSLRAAARTGKGNLLEFAIDAARIRATLGEISKALEDVYGRYSLNKDIAQGAFSLIMTDELKRVQNKVLEFEKKEGKKPRILVANIGYDGNDREANVAASGFSDMGFYVDIAPLFSTPHEIVSKALDSDVHIVYVSSLAAEHLPLMLDIITSLKEKSTNEMLIACCRKILHRDYEALNNAGPLFIFNPGESVIHNAEILIDKLMKNK